MREQVQMLGNIPASSAWRLVYGPHYQLPSAHGLAGLRSGRAYLRDFDNGSLTVLHPNARAAQRHEKSLARKKSERD
ncbi:hypothetical protein KEU06_12545 [Pseudaminobacter sp. 19-2017]|uniref:Uncharacterized protein n=1 Tax=Pseudaminobacter soli (ex Zhang et al. 2022) TaxID=2831468 RepID=A0A942E6P2_9HYPH|nr:hypothetical protein [Pseudaminobacter soli]MBS3649437.1 hypothetical protein [Pseudaminobacter soli]